MDPLARLGRLLRAGHYRFVTPTPETHRRVVARQGRAKDLRGVFGWSLPFERPLLPKEMFDLLGEAGALVEAGAGLFTSAVRYSTIGGLCCVHSAYPTLAADSVFFGPDTYRFASLIESRIIESPGHVVDVGCGSGAGGLLLAGRAASVQLLDINQKALAYAAANAALNGLSAKVAHSDVLAGAQDPIDLVIANPPYLADEQARTYRDGGGPHGTSLSVRIAKEALGRLHTGGRLLLYTATPVVDGEHVLWPELRPLLVERTTFEYRELDPDVFGEELDRPAYAHAERIAVVALDAIKG